MDCPGGRRAPQPGGSAGLALQGRGPPPAPAPRGRWLAMSSSSSRRGSRWGTMSGTLAAYSSSQRRPSGWLMTTWLARGVAEQGRVGRGGERCDPLPAWRPGAGGARSPAGAQQQRCAEERVARAVQVGEDSVEEGGIEGTLGGVQRSHTRGVQGGVATPQGSCTPTGCISIQTPSQPPLPRIGPSCRRGLPPTAAPGPPHPTW